MSNEMENFDLISNDLFFSGWIQQNSELFVQYSVNIVSALLILLVGKFVVGVLSKSVEKLLVKRKFDTAVVGFTLALVRYGLFVIVIMAALGQVGVETTSIVAVIGAAGLAVGLALQGSLSNFASGVLIVSFRPFKAGDFVEVSGVAGSVESIQIFQTTLKTVDNKMVVIPNGNITSNSIVNYSRYNIRRVDLVIGVSYKSDLQLTKKVIYEALSKDDRILTDPEIMIGVSELSDSSVNLVVRPWCKTADYWNVYFDSMQSIKETLDENGIEIPFPQMDVHLNKV